MKSSARESTSTSSSATTLTAVLFSLTVAGRRASTISSSSGCVKPTFKLADFFIFAGGFCRMLPSDCVLSCPPVFSLLYTSSKLSNSCSSSSYVSKTDPVSFRVVSSCRVGSKSIALFLRTSFQVVSKPNPESPRVSCRVGSKPEPVSVSLPVSWRIWSKS
ncbi:hypothetical protein HanRHA438_Chr03g0133281 [Helianthus annuus]|uniref:Uncharacterized protein n=1 Tax=Helianthus annuus TaxID=4232 RepID=A0A9K3JGM5_HELAN|nr:hypothetical protein HanXRQr2_Chr03g0121421 [Helianthus annuus]KAJ0936625.1 hypothetical protein HanRHA438_Chr03g0133281 [Helianthus annuus]